MPSLAISRDSTIQVLSYFRNEGCICVPVNRECLANSRQIACELDIEHRASRRHHAAGIRRADPACDRS